VQSHKELQELSDTLVGYFNVEDKFVLRSAITEGLQNTIQHSDGRFAVQIEPELIMIVNAIKENHRPKSGIGLHLYAGIYTFSHRHLFYTVIFPHKVRLQSLNIEALVNQ